MFSLPTPARLRSAHRDGGTQHGSSAGGRRRGLGGNPYIFLGPRPFREARLRSYIVSRHRAGRTLAEILADPYVRRLAGESLCWRVIEDPRTIEAFERDVCESIARCSKEC